MFDLDLESILLALLLTYAIVCVLLVYVLVGAFILVHQATSALARFFCAVGGKLRTVPTQFAAYTLGKPAHDKTQHLAFNYLIMLAHHGRQP